jgi:hypothetical protein
MLFPKTTTRVEENTRPEVNEALRAETRSRIARYARAPESEIRERLEELDREWDVERALETNAAAAVLGTLLLGKTVDKRFYALTAAVGGFLLQHALQGWCPPLPALRRLGFRTASEIEHEREALHSALRSRSPEPNGKTKLD